MAGKKTHQINGMFINAIEKITGFTKPLHTITRSYGGMILPGSSTIFFVNEDAVAITCKHVVALIAEAERVNSQYASFKSEADKLARDGKYKRNVLGLETKYQFKKETIIQIKNRFLGCVDKFSTVRWIAHPTLDLAILILEGFDKILYSGFATFVKDPNKIKQGRSLCRLGFPFPEYTNFRHNPSTDEIEWTAEGKEASPSFPIDGMITRFLGPSEDKIEGIELSTPGLKGQSGGPLFDTDALVYGMQYATNHLHLGFDLKDREVITDGKKTKVSNYPFLHVGYCIHVDRIKKFLEENKIKFYEG